MKKMTANEAASRWAWQQRPGSQNAEVDLFDARGNPIVQRGYDLPDLYLDAKRCLERKDDLETKGIHIKYTADDVERLRTLSGAFGDENKYKTKGY